MVVSNNLVDTEIFMKKKRIQKLSISSHDLFFSRTIYHIVNIGIVRLLENIWHTSQLNVDPYVVIHTIFF